MKFRLSDRCLNWMLLVIWSILGVFLLVSVGRIFCFDQFRINGVSMEPALETGDCVLVNKFILGARIYRDFDFSQPKMKCVRTKGYRSIRPGDVVVFNYPYARSSDEISFKLNDVYVKRCIGIPGDSVAIQEGYYVNSNFPDGLIGNRRMQQSLHVMSDSSVVQYGIVLTAMPYSPNFSWTIRNFGPLYVPKRGDKVKVDMNSFQLYRKMIEYETGSKLKTQKGKFYLDKERICEYEFKSNWYFFGGDNVYDSKDSRYFGLVPEDYIVGITQRILYSKDNLGKIRWKRILKKIAH